MSRQEIVKVRIGKKTGKVEIEGEGFVGEGCNCLEQLEESLGMVQQRVDKDEKYIDIVPDPALINC